MKKTTELVTCPDCGDVHPPMPQWAGAPGCLSPEMAAWAETLAKGAPAERSRKRRKQLRMDRSR